MSGVCEKCGKKTDFSWENLCYSCSKEKALEDVQQAIAEGEEDVDTTSDDYIICPCCGNAIEPCYYDDDRMYIEDSFDYECEECGKTFEVEVSVSIHYETHKKE